MQTKNWWSEIQYFAKQLSDVNIREIKNRFSPHLCNSWSQREHFHKTRKMLTINPIERKYTWTW